MVMASLAKDSWKTGSLESWFKYVEWKRLRISKNEVAELYRPYLKRVRELFGSKPKNEEIYKIYSQFAVDLFQGGRYNEAEKLYEEMLSWAPPAEDPKWWTDIPLYRANGFLIFALLKQRDGDVPQAMRLAQQAIEISQDQQFGLLYCMYLSRGWRNNMQVKPYAVNLMQTLRANSKAPFKDPFEEKKA